MTDNFLQNNLNLASNLLNKGKINRALDIFNLLSTKYPNNAQVYHLKAYAHIQTNNINLSINNFEKALKISSFDCNINLDYCNLLNSIGKTEIALSKLNMFIKNYKADYKIFFLKGCIEMNFQYYEKAIDSFKKVLELKFDHKDASYNLGAIYFEIKNYELAEKIFNTYIKIFGDDIDIEKYLFQIYLISYKLEKAEKISDNLCIKYPNDSLVWYERARLSSKQNKSFDAIEAYKKCLKITPDFNDAFKNLSLILKKEGLLEKYIEDLKNNKIFKIKNHTKYTNLAQALFINEKYEEALENIEIALQIYPNKNTIDKDFLNAKMIKGTILEALQDYAKAIKIYHEILEIDKNIFQIYVNIGNSLVKLKREKEAINFFKKSLSINPNYAIALLNLGDVYFKLGEKEQALEYFKKANQIDPYNSNILSSKAAAHIELNEELKAINDLQKAIEINPNNENAYLNLGIIFQNQNIFNQSFEMFDACISLSSLSNNKNKLIASAYANKGLSYLSLNRFDKVKDNFLKSIEFDKERELAIGFIYYSKLYCADWNNLENYKKLFIKNIKRGHRSSTPFCSFSMTDNPKVQLEVAMLHCGSKKLNNLSHYHKEKYYHHKKHLKPRVAYISYDFHDHATYHLMAGLFKNQDHTNFDYYAFSYSDKGTRETEFYNKAKKYFKKFFLVKDHSDKEICKMLKDNEIDIAVDLKGHTYKTRINILSSRPCPIQITFLGHPGTTGANYIDYVIADNFVVTSKNEKYFSEKVIKLPNCYQPNDNERYFPENNITKKELGFPEDSFVFCSFNSPYKIQPEVFKVWMEILNENKNSILWLLKNQNSESTKNILKYASSQGIDEKRIFFLKRCNMKQYLQKMKCADLFLDTFPISAHTTASDALWVGVPLITCVGKSMVSRVAGSILKNIDMKELITRNLEDYKKLAIKLSKNKKYYNEIKVKIEKNRLKCNLFDTQKYTKFLEKEYFKLYENFKKNL